ETLVAELGPRRALQAKGLHHLSACEGTVVFDALRSRPFWTPLLSGGGHRRLATLFGLHAKHARAARALTPPR
ncbi:MAG: hypothetical protein ACREVD_02010, partial [Burkholderiales bacterium]